MSRRTLGRRALAGLLLAAGGLLNLHTVAAGGSAEGTGPVMGQIEYIEGEVSVNGKDVGIGDTVLIGATVATGASSLCEIVFGGSNIFQIQADTVAVIDLDPKSKSMRLSQGSLAAVFNKVQVLGRTGSFQVTTPSAIAGVRGTVFFVKVEDADNTYVCACYGELAVNPRSDNLRLAATHHTARRFTRSESGHSVVSAGLMYHDDAGMDALARKIGSSIPWGTGSYGEPETEEDSGYGYGS